MERFEIALSLNDKQLLIPSMLPREKPGMQLHQMQKLIKRNSVEKVRHNATVYLIYSLWTKLLRSLFQFALIRTL